MKKHMVVWLLLMPVFATSPVLAEEKIDSDKLRITTAWQKYFRSLTSLKVSSKMVWTRKAAFGREAINGETWKNKLFIEGNKYRAESILPKSVKEFEAMVQAYDGKVYQTLQVSELPNLRISQNPVLHNPNPYIGTNPLTDLFFFAIPRTDVQNFETLQQARTWAYLAQRITRIQKTAYGGRSGMLLDINFYRTKGEGTFQVFVDNSTLFPIFVKTFPTSNKTQFNQLVVAQTKNWGSAGSNFVFPLRIESKSYDGAALLDNAVTQVDASTLEINRPIGDEVFTLPRTQATNIETDEGRRKRKQKYDEQQAKKKQ